MVAWIFLLVLITVEVIALRWWLNKEYYPVMFNGWAALIYSAVLALDFFLMWLVASTFSPGEAAWPQLLTFVGVGAVIVTLIFTLFFRWVVRQDLNDPK